MEREFDGGVIFTADGFARNGFHSFGGGRIRVARTRQCIIETPVLNITEHLVADFLVGHRGVFYPMVVFPDIIVDAFADVGLCQNTLAFFFGERLYIQRLIGLRILH